MAGNQENADAKELRFPVLVHGFLKTDSAVGSIDSNAPATTEKTIELKVPKDRRPECRRLCGRSSVGVFAGGTDEVCGEWRGEIARLLCRYVVGVTGSG